MSGILKFGFPVRSPELRKYWVDQEQCPECGGALDTGWECNDCGFDAQWIAYPQSERERDKGIK